MLDIIGLPIEALNIDEHHLHTLSLLMMCGQKEAYSCLTMKSNEDLRTPAALVKKFSDERGRYKNDMMSLAFDIIQTIRTLRADAHGLEVITHGERQRMREEGTEVVTTAWLATKKAEGVPIPVINFRDTFREAFHRSAMR